ncbi:hypothetical protein TWF694_003299 [Orbilia ellipsospora]|uniref:Uncharacterized protein n=1 Tax=Orbilia ellipsospora TaxID=2528407 RepID=A0AAV9X176_9PEZI
MFSHASADSQQVRLIHLADEKVTDLKSSGYAGLTIPSFPNYNRDTADLKITLYLEPGPNLPFNPTDKRRPPNNSIINLINALNKEKTKKVTYLVHTSKFRALDEFRTMLFNINKNGKENLKGGNGKVKCIAVTPSDRGDLAKHIFDRVVEWCYTSDYRPNKTTVDEYGKLDIGADEILDKKMCAAGILLGCMPLLEYGMMNLRERMDAEYVISVEFEKEENRIFAYGR